VHLFINDLFLTLLILEYDLHSTDRQAYQQGICVRLLACNDKLHIC